MEQRIAETTAAAAALEGDLTSQRARTTVLETERSAAEDKLAAAERSLAGVTAAHGSLETQRLVLGALLALAIAAGAFLSRRKPTAPAAA